MSQRDLGRQLHDPGLRELADVGDRLTAAACRFGLGRACAFHCAELRVGDEPGELLADDRVVDAPVDLREREQLGDASSTVPVAAGGIGSRPRRRRAAEHAALRARRREPGVRAAGADARALEEQRRLRDRPAVALARR